jgi:ABC-type Mn2+/Zn2+ transport system ATPase subunit
MPLLSVDKVVAYRSDYALFVPASFSVDMGDCLRITGGNGLGKTTLLDSIAGLYWNWSGRIQRPKRQVSYLQQAALYVRTLSLSRLSRLIPGFDERRYSELVENLGLKEVQNDLLALVSGGELQRARLLLSLLRPHTVLLLDEPFANIDMPSCQAIMAELDRTRSGRATLIVTHPQDAHGSLLRGCPQYELRRCQC